MNTLSKSDFKVASTCAKKLQYKKQQYPNSMEEDEFLKILAEGGYVIGKLATIVHDGTEITGNTKEALEQTQILLQQDHITLHEAAIQADQKLIRIDILKKNGNVFDLIEVKAKSFDSEEDGAEEKKNMQEYIEDVVFQTLVLQEAYPGSTINAFLLMPDKSKQTKLEGLASWFTVLPEEEKETEIGRFRKIDIAFIDPEGSEEYRKKRKLLLDDDLLQLMPLNEKVEELSDIIRHRSAQFLRIMNSEFSFEPGDYSLTKKCKDCEYRAENASDKNGFNDCWGALAKTDPNLFELYYGGAIGHYTKGFYFDELIVQKKFSLYDIDFERLKTAKGEIGSRAQRQIIQIENTKQNKEWFSTQLGPELENWQYPLHFIDFETSSSAIPFHKGMRPYETIAFQWSCHTIYGPGEAPVHKEWINEENSFPNFRFAQSLMELIEHTGTPLMWATHENTVLRRVLQQMDVYEYEDDTLKAWLTDITKDKGREGRFIDMNAFTLQHYFHPYMKGRTSIKKTLPAVWNYHSSLYEIPWFQPYYKADEQGATLNPYETLKYIFAAGSFETEMAEKEIEEVIKEGGAAMKAYYNMMYGPEKNRGNIKKQLLEYCKLDTMAMVMIWTYWNSRLNS